MSVGEDRFLAALWKDLRDRMPLPVITSIVALASGALLWWPEEVTPNLRLDEGSGWAVLAKFVFVFAMLATGYLIVTWIAHLLAQPVDGALAISKRREELLHADDLARREAFDALGKETLEFLLNMRFMGATTFQWEIHRDPDGNFIDDVDEDFYDSPLFTPRRDAKSTVKDGTFRVYDIHPYALDRLDDLLSDPDIRKRCGEHSAKFERFRNRV